MTAGVNAVLASIEGHPWTGSGSGAVTTQPTAQRPWIEYVVWGIFGLVVLVFLVTHPRMALWILWGMFSGRRGGGGGFGGGGFGGGGGRSGGGGARGGW